MAQATFTGTNNVKGSIGSSHMLSIAADNLDTNEYELQKYDFSKGEFTLKSTKAPATAIGANSIFEIYECDVAGLNGWYICDSVAANATVIKIADLTDKQKKQAAKAKPFDLSGNEINLTSGKLRFKKQTVLANASKVSWGETSRTEISCDTTIAKGTIAGDVEYGEGSIEVYKHEANPDYALLHKVFESEESQTIAILDKLGNKIKFSYGVVTGESEPDIDSSGELEKTSFKIKWAQRNVERTISS